MNDYTISFRQVEMIGFLEKRIMFGARVLCLLFSMLVTSDFGEAQAAEKLDAEARQAIVLKISELLSDNYVYPETGKKMAAAIEQNLKKGAYSEIDRSSVFASRLMQDLREISRDLHLRVLHDPRTAQALLWGGEESEELRKQRLDRQRSQDFGFEKVDRLAGNVGYLDLRYFAASGDARDTAARAMSQLVGSAAVVIDLRFNGGGSPDMVRFVCSYFFDEKPVHLNSLYWRPADRTDEFWTLRDLPGERMPDVDLYILTSQCTFSGAEEFTYNMKNLKRATIVGEITGGGAHPVNSMPVNDQIVITVPVGRAINPITKTNWEGVGVQPDISVPAPKALSEAHFLALKKVLQHTSDPGQRTQLQEVLQKLEADRPLRTKK
jgi:hypothetical protein